MDHDTQYIGLLLDQAIGYAAGHFPMDIFNLVETIQADQFWALHEFTAEVYEAAASQDSDTLSQASTEAGDVFETD
jgi:mono/diheme cytochrome c family protein